MNPRKATALVKGWIASKGLVVGKVTSRTIGFADLARDSAVFVKVEGWTPSLGMAHGAELQIFAKANGFFIQFSGPGIIN